MLQEEYEKLQAEKENLMYSINGDRRRFDALDNLIKSLSKMEMIGSFEDEFFQKHIDHIKVLSRTEIIFVLKCGLKLKERLVV